MAASRYIWHHDLHRKLAAERLYFLAFEFYPNYDRTIATSQLKLALHKAGVISYVIWEALGSVDLIAKVWLQSRIELPELKQILFETVQVPHQFNLHVFSVERTLHHWMWPKALPLTVDQLRQRIPERHQIELNGPSPPPTSAIRAYLADGLVTRVRPDHSIKFFMRVTRPAKGTDDHYLERELNQKLSDAVTSAQESGALKHPAVYLGDGFAKYFITGRVAPNKWENMSTSLTGAVNDLGMQLFRGMRTLTHISAFSQPVDLREQLLSIDQATPQDWPDLGTLLKQDEHRMLEFKSSAFTDVRRAVHTGENLVEDDRIQDSIIKSVAGMLNASGGTLAIGVAEQTSFTASELERIYATPREEGSYIVVGVDKEFRRKSWDAYERRLRQLLASNIEPDPTAWIHIESLQHDAGQVAAVRIRRPDQWYYARSAARQAQQPPRFYARLGNETQPLDGTAMDNYRQSNLRTTAR